MTKLAGIALFVLGTLRAQSVNRAQAWFPDGTGLEIHTESTGSTQTDSGGEIGIGPGAGSQDLVNRVVVDSGNNLLFVYNLEASRGAGPNTVSIRLEPISAATEAEMLKRRDSRRPKFSGSHLPTVAAVRQFPSVKIGEVVTVDILYNPSTGEKIYDVIRPLAGPPPTPPPYPMVTETHVGETISLKEITVKVNGRTMHAPASWMLGAAARIDIPGHGAYVIAAADPQNAVPGFTFRPMAHADGKTLRWAMDRDKVEIVSGTNVLTQSVMGVLWVYHAAGFRSPDQPNTVRLQTADTVDWLLPRL